MRASYLFKHVRVRGAIRALVGYASGKENRPTSSSPSYRGLSINLVAATDVQARADRVKS